ncbi:hypothetical protein DDZ13_13705 [Coraliomargarita sinensis]|uniref:Protein kinase domain-containing protein n=1 Tax=Coraliomargarita sinensis TaxID=2174842 RepID=A0A317ZGP6_9BACT|nr:lipopolysaccharide kinase InaA family protein [Coraliomargarita sinensis]PXA03118.1 hypothetical protein DDZ13_13705 [Coraliomargarita sinensis]
MLKVTKLWHAPEKKCILEDAGLLDIGALSRREFDWFEAPNLRRGGWSGVSKIVLNPDAAEESDKAVFLKIQKNHFYRAPDTCFLKRLTFEREFSAMMTLRDACAAIPKVLLFAKWQECGDQYSVLVTESLEDWWPLGPWLKGELPEPPPDEATLNKALEAIAATACKIHQAGWLHMCYSAKHLFVRKQDNGEFDVRVVDLEKTRKRLGLGRRTVKDCSHFMRHTPKLGHAEKNHFLKSYFQTEHFNTKQRKLIHKMRGGPGI